MLLVKALEARKRHEVCLSTYIYFSPYKIYLEYFSGILILFTQNMVPEK